MKSKKCIKLNKRLSIILIGCMLFQILQVNFLYTEKVFGATGFRHETVGNDVVLGGNYIEVGISKSGSFGTATPAPSGFHPTNVGVGLRVDGDGFDRGNPPTTGDFFLPGTPEESFTIGYKAGSSGATPTKYTNAERVGELDITTVTTDTSSGDTLSALTSGTTSDGNLGIQQNISFKVNDKFFKNTVTYTNIGSSTLYDVRYMRSFDPDQDADLEGDNNTKNQVIENFAGTEGRAIVKAAGGTTGETVFFISTDNRARVSNPGLGLKNRDPYDLRLYNIDGAALKRGEKIEDSAIAITFALGNLAPGESTTFEYYTSLDPDYNSGLEDIMSSLGLQINNGAGTTSSLDVTLNLSGKNVAQMRFSNDNSSWSSWEPYASTKAWTLTSGDGRKTVYAQFKDSKDNVSSVNASIVYAIPDTTAPTITDVTGNPSNWTSGDVTLTVNASDASSGLASAAYSFDGGSTWQAQSKKTYTENTSNIIVKVKDAAGNIAAYDAINITKIDKSVPNAKITIKDKEFTSILNTITFGIFYKETVNVTISADDNISGVNKIEYQKVLKASDYNPDGTWTSGSAFNAAPDDKFVVYARVTDNAGNYVIVNSDGIVVDATKPALALTPDAVDWTNSNVTVKIEASDELAGIKEVTYATNETVPQAGTVAIKDGIGTITLNNEGQYELTVTAKDNALNEVTQRVNIKIDKTAPKLIGASEASSYFIGRVIKLTDDFGEIADATYKHDSNTETSFKNEALFEKIGKYTLTLKDKAGNSTTLSFEIKELPKVENIVYTLDCKALIEGIRAEFDSHNDLPEPYKTSADNEIKALEARYSQLHKEVMDIKAETSVIEGKMDILPKEIDGILNLQKEIQDEYNKIAGTASTLTAEQKKSLETEAENLAKWLNDCLNALSRLMLHDEINDLTVIGIKGTIFNSDVYLVVTPYKADNTNTKFAGTAERVNKVAKTISKIKEKELVALYDVSLFKGSVKTQPDGEVKVKIKIPENLIGRSGLDIVHIADNGTVTPMNAVVENGYLIFITTHFSDYGIVAQSITETLPKTGAAVDFNLLVVGGVLFILAGLAAIRSQGRKVK